MSAMASPQMKSSPRLDAFQQPWSFEKAMMEASQKEVQPLSDPPSPDMLSASSEDQIRISHHSPDMKNLKDRASSPTVIHDMYMSSEEQLSPLEHDSSSSAGDLEDFSEYEDEADEWLDNMLAEFTCKMATAICILQVGKPKVVDIPVPSLTSSPSLSSDSEKMPSNFAIPPRPRTPIRKRPIAMHLGQVNASKPAVRSRISGPTFVNASNAAFAVETYLPTSPEQTLNVEPLQTYTPSAPAFLKTDPFAVSRPMSDSHPPRITSHANHSRLRNLSQKLAKFAVHGNGSKVDLNEATEIHKRKNSVASFSEPTDIYPQTRSMSISVPSAVKQTSKPKMIPRGAAERAPPIEIPPCPDDNLDLEFDGPQHPKKLRRRKSNILRF